MFEQAIALLSAAPVIILHRHEHPDGDALGAQTGLAFLLRHSFPGKEVYCVGDAPGRYAFMPGSEMDSVPDGLYENALAVVLDCGSAGLVSDSRWQSAAQTLRLDHHLFTGTFCGTEVTDTSFESCAGMVAALAVEAGWSIPADAAAALFTGMVTDSGRFRYDCTTPRTLTLAARLLEAGIDTNALYNRLYAEDLDSLKLRSAFIGRIQLSPQGVAWLYNDRALVEQTGLGTAGVSRGMVGTMSDLSGIPVWVNFTENETGEVECELRSNAYNINPVAVAFGGGGHQKASGARVKDRAEAMALLAALDELVKKEKENA